MARIQTPETLMEDVRSELKRLADLTVESGLIRGEYFETRVYQIPGIGTAAAYAALDGFGTELRIPDVPTHWMLTQIDYFDPDDEGLLMRVWLANETLGVTSADNDALVIPDANLRRLRGAPVAISAYGDANTGQIGSVTSIDRLMYTPTGLFVQMQSGDVPNIAAGALPSIRFIGLA